LFDTPLEEKYILGRKFIWPWLAPQIYKMYPTEFIIMSREEFKRDPAYFFKTNNLQLPEKYGEIKRTFSFIDMVDKGQTKEYPTL